MTQSPYPGREPSFTCTCPLGYTNSLCETPVSNACDSNPCHNGGSCTLSTLNTYQCTCPRGWTGSQCTQVDHCANNPCRNGAQCTSMNGYYKCTCKQGYTGSSCELNINECDARTNPCVRGTCQDTFGGYK